MLVLTGSSVGMMETHVLGYRSPLYGRRTGQVRVGPLPFVALKDFYPRWNPEDLVRAFAVLGGIPAYLEKFDPGRGLMANIRERILDRSEFLYEEPEIVLRQELREPARYSDILECVAGGSTRMSEISIYIFSLCSMGPTPTGATTTAVFIRGKRRSIRSDASRAASGSRTTSSTWRPSSTAR